MHQCVAHCVAAAGAQCCAWLLLLLPSRRCPCAGLPGWAAHCCDAATASLQVEKKVFENVALFKRETESGKGEAGGPMRWRGLAAHLEPGAVFRRALLIAGGFGRLSALHTHAAPALCSSSRSLPAAKKEGDQLFECFDAQDLNTRLKDLMDGLSVKVGHVGFLPSQ